RSLPECRHYQYIILIDVVKRRIQQVLVKEVYVAHGGLTIKLTNDLHVGAIGKLTHSARKANCLRQGNTVTEAVNRPLPVHFSKDGKTKVDEPHLYHG